MLKPLFAAVSLLTASLVYAQGEPLVQRDLSDRSGRFIDLSPSQAEPVYVVNATGGDIRFDATGVQIAQTPNHKQSSLLKGIGVHSGLSYAFEGGASVAPAGQKTSGAVYSYFVGPQSQWNLNRSSYSELAYRNVWPGVDAVFKGADAGLKYQFELAAGADAKRVVLRIAGAQTLRVAANGAMEWSVNGSVFRDEAPIAYQMNGKRRVKVTAEYVVKQVDASTWLVGFALGQYDSALPLVIDPAWAAPAGLVGGNVNDTVNAVARDSANKATWVCGTTQTALLSQAYVAKFSDGGAGAQVYRYGGNGNNTCQSIALDSQGNVYMGGATESTDFAMVGARNDPNLRASKVGTDRDAFFAKINPANGQFVWSSLFGGTGDDQVNAIAVDDIGRLYMTGYTQPTCTGSTCIPAALASSSAVWNASTTGKYAFVARVAASGQALEYFKGLNGDGDINIGHAISVDPLTNAVVVAGETNSTANGMPSGVTGFNTTPNARPTDGNANGDVADGFVARINPTGSGYDNFTLLTGRNDTTSVRADRAYGVKLLSDGSVLVVGETSSDNFPTQTPAAVTTTSPAGGMDGFVVRLSSNLGSVQSARYLGGSGYDSAQAVVPGGGGYYVLGNTGNALSNLPAANDPGGLSKTALGNQDGFLARFVLADNTVDFWGLIGASGQDAYNALAFDILDVSANLPSGRIALYAGGSSSANPGIVQQGELRRIDSFGPPTSFQIQDAGGTQSTPISTAFADLKVRAFDRLGAPVPRVIVSFQSPNVAGQASTNKPGTFAVTTDADGYATLSGVSANGTAGAYVVTVTAATATAQFNLTNLKADQVGFTVAAASSLAYQATTTLQSSGGLPGPTVTYAFDPTDTSAGTFCSLTGNQVKAIKADGSCKVIATNPGNSNYNPAKASALISTIKATQPGFAVSASPNSVAVNGTSTISFANVLATGSANFTIDAGSAAICEIASANSIRALATGNCKVNANAPTDGNYLEAVATTDITVTKGALAALTVHAIPAALTYGQGAALTVDTNASSGAVTFAWTSGPCTVNGSQLTSTGVGTCVVAATQATDANYQASSGSVSVLIDMAAQQALVLSASSSALSPGQTAMLTTTGGTTNLPVNYAILAGSPSVCTLSGTTVNAVSVGSCTLQATMLGDVNYYNVQTSPITINVSNQPQLPISVSSNKTTMAPTETANVTATGGSGTINFTYAVVSGGTSCTVHSNTGLVTATTTLGTCVINASNPASTGFDPATSANSVSITVANRPQAAINLAVDKTSIAPQQTAKVTATGGSGTIDFTYTLESGAASCTLDTKSGNVTATAVGSCVIVASNPASTGYDSATSANKVTINVANNPQAQITVSAASTSIALNATTTVTATGGSGVIKFSYALVSGATACALDTELGVVTGKAIGSCEVRASNAASPGFDAATSSNSVTISVGKAPQNITFALPAGPMVLIAPDLALTATSDVASLTVTTFASKTSAVCEVVGTTLKFYTAGTCTVTASQEGNTDYAAAEKDASVQVTLPAGTAGTVTGSIKEGPVTAEIVGGNGWTFGPQGNPNWEVTGFFPVSGEKPPANLTFPAGLFGFTAINGPKGTPVTIKLSYPITFPANAQYWKFGKTADNATAHWYQLPNATISGNTVTFTVTDGGVGDNDLLANSVIKDPGGVAVNSDTTPVTPTTPTAVPTLGEYARWMLILLVLGMGMGALVLKRRES